MGTRQFAVRCIAINQPAPTVGRPRASARTSSVGIEQLREELTTGGLEEVVIVPDVEGDRLTIRGLAPAESKEAARNLVEHQIYDATIDLVILEPGVWIDESFH